MSYRGISLRSRRWKQPNRANTRNVPSFIRSPRRERRAEHLRRAHKLKAKGWFAGDELQALLVSEAELDTDQV